MLLNQYKTVFLNKLTSIYDSDEAASFFFLLTEHFHGLKRIDLALNRDFVLSEYDLQKWNDVLEALKQQKPIQYITGNTEFYGLNFKVNENVLIPRPETEELVDWIIRDFSKKQQPVKILDIGTGSGCIAVSLAKNLSNAQVFAMDVSEKALQTAKDNAVLNNVEVRFLCQDILKCDELPEKFDVIVSNPPYVRNLEKQEIKPNVLHYEPHLALFVENEDPLIFYKKIAALAKDNLNKNGILYFEINQYLGKETIQTLQNLKFGQIELKKDLFGNDRMIKCVK